MVAIYQVQLPASTNITNTFSGQIFAWLESAPIISCFCYFVPIYWIVFNCALAIYKKLKKIKHSSSNCKFYSDVIKTQLWQKFNKEFTVINVFILSYFLFLASRSIVYNYYFIPFLVFVPFSIGLLSEFFIALLYAYFQKKGDEKSRSQRNAESNNIDHIKSKKERSYWQKLIVISLLGAWMIVVLIPFNFSFLATNYTQYQFQALSWVKNNLPKNSVIVVDNFFIAELRDDGSTCARRMVRE